MAYNMAMNLYHSSHMVYVIVLDIMWLHEHFVKRVPVSMETFIPLGRIAVALLNLIPDLRPPCLCTGILSDPVLLSETT